MKKAKAFRHHPTHSAPRMAKASNAAEAIGSIEPGDHIFILTYGQFSLIDALLVILDQTGPAEVDLSTWTAADAHLERTAELLKSATIRRFRMIVDFSFPTRQPEYCYHMQQLFGQDCIRCVRSHGKYLAIRGDSMNVTIGTSMNLNENPRLEHLELTEGRELADFVGQVFDEIFTEVEPGKRRSALPHMKEIDDTYRYNEVRAEQIPRESLSECQVTHTIEKFG